VRLLRTSTLTVRARPWGLASFSSDCDLRRRVILRGAASTVPVVAAVAAPQMRQQLMLRILGDHVLRAVDLDPGLVELLQQPIDRYFEDLGELRDRYICHTAAPKPFPLPQTNACGHP
jgi:hypothetical protein